MGNLKRVKELQLMEKFIQYLQNITVLLFEVQGGSFPENKVGDYSCKSGVE
jgi:hypothetical protein